MLRTFIRGLVCLLSTSLFAAHAQSVLTQFPPEINSEGRYVFYSHGYIVEGDNPTPRNSRWGTYDFPRIKSDLADHGYHLIAYHRGKNTDPREHAQELVTQAQRLIKQGVKPEAITFIGFSRGGYITILVSNLLRLKDVNFVLLAACGESITATESVELYGEVLSVHETSDDLVLSCQALAARSSNISSFEEILISTGKEHGAFYQPIPEWLLPVKEWVNRTMGDDKGEGFNR